MEKNRNCRPHQEVVGLMTRARLFHSQSAELRVQILMKRIDMGSSLANAVFCKLQYHHRHVLV